MIGKVLVSKTDLDDIVVWRASSDETSLDVQTGIHFFWKSSGSTLSKVPADMTHTKLEQDNGASSTEILSPDQQELSQILKNIRHDPTLLGILHFGTDGILRSLTADRDVVDAVALPPRLIKAFLDRRPFNQESEDMYRGVDGSKTPKEQWFHPDKISLPPPLSEANRVEARKMIEEHGLLEKFEERQKGKEEERGGGCGPVVRSNYDLGIKEKM